MQRTSKFLAFFSPLIISGLSQRRAHDFRWSRSKFPTKSTVIPF